MVDCRIKHPCNIMVTGSSGSGKTWLTAFLLKNRKIVFDCQPAIVIWFYREGTNQEIYEQLRDEKWVDEFYAVSKNGFGEIKDLLNKFPRSQPKFFIYDDLMTMISMDTAELFTNLSHHRSLTNIFLSQSLYLANVNLRIMTKNSHYHFFCRNLKSKGDYVRFAQQIEPSNSRMVVAIFSDALKKPFSHLLVDTHPKSTPSVRFRSYHFPDVNRITTYYER